MFHSAALWICSIALVLPLALGSPVPESPKPRNDEKHDDHGNKFCNNQCLTKSYTDFAWQVKGLDYHATISFTTPAHQNSWGSVSFNLTNPAVDVTATCSASTNRWPIFFYGDQWFPCSVPDASKNKVSDVSFRFLSQARLDINETWTCPSLVPKKTVNLVGTGTVALNLTCEDVFWQNPNWTMGSGTFYSTEDIKCTPIDLPVKAAEVKRQ